jgi:hypothetical protein
VVVLVCVGGDFDGPKKASFIFDPRKDPFHLAERKKIQQVFGLSLFLLLVSCPSLGAFGQCQ